MLISNVLLMGEACHSSNSSEGVITAMNYYLIPPLLKLKKDLLAEPQAVRQLIIPSEWMQMGDGFLERSMWCWSAGAAAGRRYACSNFSPSSCSTGIIGKSFTEHGALFYALSAFSSHNCIWRFSVTALCRSSPAWPTGIKTIGWTDTFRSLQRCLVDFSQCSYLSNREHFPLNQVLTLLHSGSLQPSSVSEAHLCR